MTEETYDQPVMVALIESAAKIVCDMTTMGDETAEEKAASNFLVAMFQRYTPKEEHVFEREKLREASLRAASKRAEESL